MANINLSNDKIKSINSEITSLDSALLNSYIPSLKDTIGQIKSNVLNEQVNQILGTISSQVDTISGELRTDLPKLEQFLDTQMTEYTTSESEAEGKVNTVLGKMQAFAGETSTATTTSTGSNSETSGTETSTNNNDGNASSGNEYSHEWGGKYAETWSTWWGDVKEAYTGGGGTHGLLSGTVNTVEAACDTVGAVVETVGNGLSDACHVVGNVVDWILG